MYKKNNISRSNAVINTAQGILWICVLITPAIINFLIEYNEGTSLKVLLWTLHILAPSLVIYFLNYLIIIPKMLFLGDKKKFYVTNFLLLTLTSVVLFSHNIWGHNVNDEFKMKIYAAACGLFFFNILIIVASLGLRYIMRWNDLQMKMQEERRKSAEAELSWLKYQLKPHFLFNTLNNISSLTQIDPDKAQDCISQLSDLLRYALYDNKLEQVELSGEIKFMENYIDLMKLRCNDLTTIRTNFENPNKKILIAPLLFVSIIENAFKHGINSRTKSFVNILLKYEENKLIFICENSYFKPDNSNNKIDSGIGLENMKRRLELLYPNKYKYLQEIKNNVYRVNLTLFLK